MTELKVSPSQINLFLNEPALWVMNKFYKIYGDMGPGAWRGSAVEKGLESIILHGKSFEDGLEWAYKVFSEEVDRVNPAPEGTEEEKALIEPMLKQALELFLPLDGLQATQIKLDGEISGVKITGVADFDYGYHIDLKTTKRCPSCAENISAEHMTQLAVYSLLSGKEQRIAYVTDKKGIIYTPDPKALKATERRIIFAIKAMKAAWDMSFNSGDASVAIFYPPRDTSSFYWDDKTRKAASEIWV